MSKSSCCNKRIMSNTVAQGLYNSDCIDVCTNPSCGDPKYLTVLTPVVYDEIGINICRTIELGAILAPYPTATTARVEVIDISIPMTGGTEITVTEISGRPNCYEISLTNLVITFALKLYDCCNRLLATLPLPNIVYLPTDEQDLGFDPDTNPSRVELVLFAPYGVAYTDADVSTPYLNFIGFSSTNNALTQGLNMLAIPKVLNFDITELTITIGLTLIIESVYFTNYQLPHNKKAIISKGNLASTDDSVCMEFVSGSLLDRNIKPLEFCNPMDKKTDCADYTPADNCD